MILKGFLFLNHLKSSIVLKIQVSQWKLKMTHLRPCVLFKFIPFPFDNPATLRLGAP